MPPELSFIVPVSNNGKPDFRYRVSNLQYMIDKFLSKQEEISYEVIFVEQVVNAKNKTYRQSLTYPRDRFRWVEIAYPEYNKCWAINVGVKMAFAPIVMISEADMFSPNLRYFYETLTWFKSKGHHWAFGWDRLKYLSNSETGALLKREIPEMPTTAGSIQMPRPSGPEGGILVYDRVWYMKIGGHNEWMQGLGGPDNEMADRAKWWSRSYYKIPFLLYHLWHPIIKPGMKGNGSGHREYNRQIVRFQRSAMKRVAPKLARNDIGNLIAPLCHKKTYVEMRTE